MPECSSYLLLFIILVLLASMFVATRSDKHKLAAPIKHGEEILEVLTRREKENLSPKALLLAICVDVPKNDLTVLQALRQLAVALDFLGGAVLDVGFIDTTSILNQVCNYIPVPPPEENLEGCNLVLYDDHKSKKVFDIIPRSVWAKSVAPPRAIRNWLEKRYYKAVEFINTGDDLLELRWAHSKGNFALVRLGMEGDSPLLVPQRTSMGGGQGQGRIIQYTTAGHVFVSLDGNRLHEDFPIEDVKGIFVIPAWKGDDIVIDLANPHTSLLVVTGEMDKVYTKKILLDYWRDRRHSQIWVQSWAVKQLTVPSHENPYYKWRLKDDLFIKCQNDYLASRRLSNPESLISTVFNQLDIEGALYYSPLKTNTLNLLEKEVLQTASDWLGSANLKVTGSYGVREYRRGAVISFHNDPAETQPLTAIIHLSDSDTDAGVCKDDFCEDEPPWEFEIATVDESVLFFNQSAHITRITLDVGEAILLESARVPHGRTKRLKSDWYGNAFVHLAPNDWFHYIEETL